MTVATEETGTNKVRITSIRISFEEALTISWKFFWANLLIGAGAAFVAWIIYYIIRESVVV